MLSLQAMLNASFGVFDANYSWRRNWIFASNAEKISRPRSNFGINSSKRRTNRVHLADLSRRESVSSDLYGGAREIISWRSWWPSHEKCPIIGTSWRVTNDLIWQGVLVPYIIPWTESIQLETEILYEVMFRNMALELQARINNELPTLQALILYQFIHCGATKGNQFFVY